MAAARSLALARPLTASDPRCPRGRLHFGAAQESGFLVAMEGVKKGCPPRRLGLSVRVWPRENASQRGRRRKLELEEVCGVMSNLVSNSAKVGGRARRPKSKA